ncbi:MAG: phospho-sugar mutase [Anaerovoracaceae bacterium]|nr:phospho-sugar mutase [Anaerovoracaceae bacterium]
MDYKQEFKKWMESDIVDAATKDELRAAESDDGLLREMFAGMLEFGTAGLRGKMRAGTNGMNVYTVRYATQGMADLIHSCGEDIGGGVTIAYDSRNNSRLYAEEAAAVLAANGIHSYIFDELRPTPELSFALRETGSIAGINITASHNPKEYNGYKAYWSDGAQLPPEHAAQVSESMRKIDIFDDVRTCDFTEAVKRGDITVIGRDMDEKYIARVLEQSVGGKYVRQAADDFEVVYTPFHGAGYKLVPEVLTRLGIKHIIPVEEQMVPDGDFPTVKSPNPENAEGFALAIALAKEKDVDLVIGTDPDSDRCGCAVRAGSDYVIFTGNQIGVLLLDYLITMKREQGTLPENAAAVKSIVSTRMFDRICEMNGVTCVETLTGFKFIGEKIKEFLETGEYTFLFGFEESLGFLAGTYARDKDAVIAAMLLSEAACYYRTKGMTLYDALMALYEKYGYYKELTTSVVFEGLEGKQDMKDLMAGLRSEPPKEIGLPVTRIRDYQKGTITDISDRSEVPTGMGKSDVLFYELADGCAAVIRPSGTEPKIKLYVMACGQDAASSEKNFDAILSEGTKLLQKA